MNTETMKENLNRWIPAHDNTEYWDAAKTWYSEANSLARIMNILNPNIDIERAACIIAAFSIRRKWEQNVKLAIHFAQNPIPSDMPIMGNHKTILTNIMAYSDPFRGLNGDKTNRFARNISGDLQHVTIDVWMLRALGLDEKKSPGKMVYRQAEKLIQEMAAEYNVAPAVLQAAIWVNIRIHWNTAAKNAAA